MKNQHMKMAIGLYVNYIIHGTATLILSQNTEFLAEKWGVGISVVLWVISGMGAGKIFTVLFSGALSDKFGRKPFVVMGCCSYIIFFLGILFSPNPTIAFICAFIGGASNALLDAGTYPALIEAFPKRAGFASMLIGFAVSWGQFLFPLLLAFLLSNGIWLGWSFIIPVILLVLCIIFISTQEFPSMEVDEVEEKEEQIVYVGEPDSKKVVVLDIIVFTLYAFFCQATAYIVIQWLATYAAELAGVSDASSRLIISLYGLGAILCVPITYKLGDLFKNDSYIVLLYTAISAVACVLVLLFPSMIMCAIFAMLIGIACEGGVMQLVLVIMTRFFPKSKGKCTSLYYGFTGVASFFMPLMTGAVVGYGIRSVMVLDLVVAVIALVLAVYIFKRYKEKFGDHSVKALNQN